jgi:hypothetical protein
MYSELLLPPIIRLEDGWNDKIKKQVSIPKLSAISTETHRHSLMNDRTCSNILSQAIDVLLDMLENGLQKGKTSLFAPDEYIPIYTYVVYSFFFRIDD